MNKSTALTPLNTDITTTLRLDHIVKKFGTTVAINNVSCAINRGEIVGLVGGNGAGKSTLMRILSGVVRPDEGSLSIGTNINWDEFGPKPARELGIRVVTQELSLCTNLTVAENYFIEYPKLEGSWRVAASQRISRVLADIFPNPHIGVTTIIDDLNLAQRQMVEIARAVSDPNLAWLVLDEPTSSLPRERVNQLLDYLKRLRQQGVGIIYISHRLPEVLAVTTRVVAMRNGSTSGEVNTVDTTESDVVGLMGGKVTLAGAGVHVAKNDGESEDCLLRLDQFDQGILQNIDMTINRGEIIGISGLEGSGQSELIRLLYRLRQKRSKSLQYHGNVALVSGNRAEMGIFAYWSIAKNITIASLRQIARLGILSNQQESKVADYWYNRLKFRAAGTDSRITSLSGGNQQKALIARALATNADILLLDDPTRGVDLETKFELYQLLHEWANQGHGVVWFSTEDDEMEQCDRVYILRRGRVVDELSEGITADRVVASAFMEVKDEKKQSVHESTLHRGVGWRLLTARWNLSLFSLIIIFIVMGVLNPTSISTFGLNLLIGSAVPLVFAGISQMFVIDSGGIDLGLGAFIGLINVITATTLVHDPVLALVIIIVLIGLYALMGALIYLSRVPAIVITLGASFIWLGLALTLQPIPGGSSPAWLAGFWNVNIPVIPLPIVLSIAGLVGVYIIVQRTKLGVLLRGFGNAPNAISHAGWSGLKLQMGLYALAGTAAVIAGLFVTAANGAADANSASSYTLLSIAAVILGGSEFVGGIIIPIGVVIGALTLSLIGALLGFLSLGSDYQSAVEGILLLAVLGARALTRREEN